MSESERTLVRRGAKQGRRPSAAEMRARISVLEAELAAAHEREAAMAEVLRQRTRELEESLEYQTATSNVLKVINGSAFDLQAVLDTLVETAARLCDAGMSGIAIRTGDRYRYVANLSFDPERDQMLQTMTFAPGRGSLPGRVALERQPVHIVDLAADPEFAVPQAVTIGKVRTVLGVPLLREGEPIGVLSVLRQRVEPFTERQIELVRTFADQAVIAMENARLLGELQARTRELEESLEDQTATSDVLKVISRSTFDLQPILDTLVETGQRLCDSDGAGLFIRDGEVFRCLVTQSHDPAWGGGSDDWQTTDINALVEEALNLAYHGARAHDQNFNITMERDFAAGMLPVELVPQDVTRVFLNLFGNGFYAADKRRCEAADGFGPALKVTTRDLGDEVEIGVRDNVWRRRARPADGGALLFLSKPVDFDFLKQQLRQLPTAP